MLELYTKTTWNFLTEATFTSAWIKDMKKLWYWCHKITDASIWHKPFDLIVQSKRQFFAVEVKKIENYKFKINQLRENQLTSFIKITTLERERRTPDNSCVIVIWSVEQKDFIIIPFVEIAHLSINDTIIIDFKSKTFICQ